MDNYRQSNDAIAACTLSDLADKPKSSIIFNPIVFPVMAAIVLWAFILAAIAFVWR
jgi:hypothetical protein